MNVIHELIKIQKPVWEKIRIYLPENREPRDFYQMVRDYPERKGKYFRAGLLVWSTLMHGGKASEAYLPAGIMQLSEDWLLIHDDFEDHSLERRSTKQEYRPTLNVKYGDELAVNAGDALHLLMWKAMGDYCRHAPDARGWKIFDKLNDILLKTTEGQHLELQWIQQETINVSEKAYLDMIKRKSAYYTIICPIQIGAIIAGVNSRMIKQIEEWGTPFGLAFQIWDDYMNLTQDSQVQGKETAGDILEGKRTLCFIHMAAKASTQERRRIAKIYAKTRSQKTEHDKQYVLRLMAKYGSLEYAAKTARNCAEQAQVMFSKYAKGLAPSKARELISASIDFVANRQR
jgi:geranylgeranyl pyrophosphate synthase